MKKVLAALLLLMVGMATGASAVVYGGSNLGYSGYPEFSGYRPDRPYSRESYSMQSYRSDVESYLSDIDDYIDNAKNDMQRITDAIEAARQEAEETVDEYNSFVRSGY